jgi:hypothetical protein
MMEVDPDGRVRAYAAEIDPASVPAACLAAADARAPGGRVVEAEHRVIDGQGYFEIEKSIDGLRIEVLVTPSGVVAGLEEELAAGDIPASVVAAANSLVPAGVVEAVERVVGPETLGPPEHHVKKRMNGELVRIRVTGAGAVEELRKLRCEMKVSSGR